MVTAATLVLLQPEAWAWQVTINGAANISDAANAVTVDTGGNVVAAGRTMNIANSQRHDFTVVKFSSTIGAELWRRAVHGTGDSNRRDYFGEEALSVKADAAGNIVAAGHLFNANTGTDFSVVKLSGAAGVELWRYSVSGANTYESQDIAWAVAVDSANDVIAAGVLSKGITGRNFIVIKLSGITGRELWRRIVNRSGSDGGAFTVTVDAHRDVVAAGYTSTNTSSIAADFAVVKLSGSNGTELWRQEINGTGLQNVFDDARAVTVDAMYPSGERG